MDIDVIYKYFIFLKLVTRHAPQRANPIYLRDRDAAKPFLPTQRSGMRSLPILTSKILSFTLF